MTSLKWRISFDFVINFWESYYGWVGFFDIDWYCLILIMCFCWKYFINKSTFLCFPFLIFLCVLFSSFKYLFDFLFLLTYFLELCFLSSRYNFPQRPVEYKSKNWYLLSQQWICLLKYWTRLLSFSYSNFPLEMKVSSVKLFLNVSL